MRNRRLMLLMAVALVFLLAGSAFAKVKLTF